MTSDTGALSMIELLESSPFGWELAVLTGQSLELADALWDLVGPVVAAGGRADARPAQEVADASPVGQRLSDATRARLRALADRWLSTASADFDAYPVDEAAVVADRADGHHPV